MVIIGEEELLVVPVRAFVAVVGGLPLAGLLACTALSVLLHWEPATRTHCGVANWLPSVSVAAAAYAPERYVWRVMIIADSFPRAALSVAFRNLLVSSPLRPFTAAVWFPVVCSVACALNLVEISFLTTLAAVSSLEDYYLHKISFIGFLVCGFVYMLLATWLFDYSGRRCTTSLGERSFQYKVLCCTAFGVALLLALYFFYRHNRYCEPGVYSLFALCEYATVVFNILFHCTLYYDFHDRSFTLAGATASAGAYDALPLYSSYEEKRT